MAKRPKLSDADVRKRMTKLPKWGLVGGRLHREFLFQDFVQAFSFMSAVALVSKAQPPSGLVQLVRFGGDRPLQPRRRRPHAA